MQFSPPRQGQELVHSFLALRRAVGVIAMCMPPVLLGLHYWHEHDVLTSISQSYYRDVGALFVGFLCAIGVFLVFYRGYDGKDSLAAKVAGFSAIAVSEVPCGAVCRAPLASNDALWGWASSYPVALGIVHFVAAVLMFVALACFCLFLFPRTDQGKPRGRKRQRNGVYYLSGFVIVAALGIDAANAALAHFASAGFLPDWGIAAVETIMIEFFGLSWIVKGQLVPVLND